MCIDDPCLGAAVYRLDDLARLKTFEIPVRKARRPRKVWLGEDSTIIVAGSDHGTVYVYDRRHGNLLDQLTTGSEDWIQTVTVCNAVEFPVCFLISFIGI